MLFEDPDEQYIGNIWGWKNSFIGLGIMLFFGGIYLYRFLTVPPIPPQENTTIERISTDSLSAKKDSIATSSTKK